MSGGDTPQPPPPPQSARPSGSPFGRFLTAPVLMGAALALVVSGIAFQFVSGDGDDNAGAPGDGAEYGIAGSWTGDPTATAEGPVVRLELEDDGTGTMTRGRCTGALAPFRVEQERALFDYTDASGRRGCPRRMRVRVTLVDADTLRVVERRGGRTVSTETARRR